MHEAIRRDGLTQGHVVVSLKGHDKARLYLVIEVEGRRVWMVNGKHALWDKPKKKHVQHVRALAVLQEVAWQKLINEKDKRQREAIIRSILAQEMAKQVEARLEDC